MPIVQLEIAEIAKEKSRRKTASHRLFLPRGERGESERAQAIP